MGKVKHIVVLAIMVGFLLIASLNNGMELTFENIGIFVFIAVMLFATGSFVFCILAGVLFHPQTNVIKRTPGMMKQPAPDTTDYRAWVRGVLSGDNYYRDDDGKIWAATGVHRQVWRELQAAGWQFDNGRFIHPITKRAYSIYDAAKDLR